MNRDIHINFLRSALATESNQNNFEDFFNWIKKRREAIKVNIDKIAFNEMENWFFDPKSTNLVHSSGKFFSIEGIRVKTNWGLIPEWTQPIINQPEIGFLGIITKKIDGVLHFLMQAKIEPGNINYVQLSPTLQATKSNYSKVHKGRAPLYLEYFNGTKDVKKKVLLDQLQSEQGARFIKKRNRNIIIELEDDIEVYDDFCWLTLGQIKVLLKEDNMINMDTRTVISGIPFGDYQKDVIDLFKSLQLRESINTEYGHGLLASSLENESHLHEIEEIISWLTELKTYYELEVEQIKLDSLNDWIKDDMHIYHKEQKYFKVIAVRAEIANREVKSWTQPLVESAQEGIIAFVIKRIKGVYHFLVQAKLEAGNFDILELAPTVQCLTGNYRDGDGPAFLDYVLNAKKEQILYSTYQSEEGGRFYREQNKSLIIEADDNFSIDVPGNYKWMTLNQINKFITFNNYLNIQARSLLSSILFV